MTETVTIVQAVETCAGLPSQWDAWTDTGQYLYLRYRHGHGTVTAFDSEDYKTWERRPLGDVASFEHGNEYDGIISLGEFCELAGLVISSALEFTTYGQYAVAEFHKALAEAEATKEAEGS